MRKFLLCSLGLTASLAFCSEPPPAWKESVLRDDAKKVWEACSDGGRFYSSRLIGLFRTMGSQHDGDRQFEVALLLAQVSEDPSDGLRHFLSSPDPYDRAFAIIVIQHLGDRRFLPDLEPLREDPATLKEWDILRYKSVGALATKSIERLRQGENLVPIEGAIPKWLEAARAAR